MLRHAMSPTRPPPLRAVPLLALGLVLTACPGPADAVPDAGADAGPDAGLPPCPESAPLALTLSCEPIQLETACRPPALQSGSLGALATGLPEADFAPMGDGLLVVQVGADGRLTATAYDRFAAPVGAPVVLDPVAAEFLALRVLPLADGFSVHTLRREAPGHFAVRQVLLDAHGSPVGMGVRTVWEESGHADAPVEVRFGVSANGATALTVLGLSDDGARIGELWGLETATDPAVTLPTPPFVLATAEDPLGPGVRPGDVLGYPGGGYVVAGVESFGDLGSIWVRLIPENLELWRTPLEPAPEQPALQWDPGAGDDPRFALGWYSPGRVNNEVAFLRRAWDLGGDGPPMEAWVQYGDWYGAGGLGRVLQTLAVQDDRLLQVAYEASLGQVPGTELGELFLFDAQASYSPFRGRNLVSSWTGFSALRVVRTQGDALVTAIPVVSPGGELSLSVFRLCP